jgi:hypothetical protein
MPRGDQLARQWCWLQFLGRPDGLPFWDFRHLIERARSVVLKRDETRWITWVRYSGHQDRCMEWAGMVGAVTYPGDLEPFWPYLVFGQWTHAGNETTIGLGGHRIEP